MTYQGLFGPVYDLLVPDENDQSQLEPVNDLSRPLEQTEPIRVFSRSVHCTVLYRKYDAMSIHTFVLKEKGGNYFIGWVISENQIRPVSDCEVHPTTIRLVF